VIHWEETETVELITARIPQWIPDFGSTFPPASGASDDVVSRAGKNLVFKQKKCFFKVFRF